MDKTTFKWKYLISWYAIGAIAALVAELSGKLPNSGTNDFLSKFVAIAIIAPLISFALGGIGIISLAMHDRCGIHKVQYQPLAWYALPVIATASFAFAFTIGLLWQLTIGRFFADK
jgi:Ni/Fe-hydrogenase subunit HybB-like protein